MSIQQTLNWQRFQSAKKVLKRVNKYLKRSALACLWITCNARGHLINQVPRLTRARRCTTALPTLPCGQPLRGSAVAHRLPAMFCLRPDARRWRLPNEKESPP